MLTTHEWIELILALCVPLLGAIYYQLLGSHREIKKSVEAVTASVTRLERDVRDSFVSKETFDRETKHQNKYLRVIVRALGRPTGADVDESDPG